MYPFHSVNQAYAIGMRSLFLQSAALVLGFVLLLCIPLHILEAEQHSVHHGMHGGAETHTVAVFEHMQEMGSVDSVVQLLELIIVLVFIFLLVQLSIPQFSPTRARSTKSFHPPELLTWLAIHFTSPPQLRS